jgi:hypothetical protein
VGTCGSYSDTYHWEIGNEIFGNGDTATIGFYGTGVTDCTETNSDEGTIAVTLDGTSHGTVNAYASARNVQ